MSSFVEGYVHEFFIYIVLRFFPEIVSVVFYTALLAVITYITFLNSTTKHEREKIVSIVIGGVISYMMLNKLNV